MSVIVLSVAVGLIAAVFAVRFPVPPTLIALAVGLILAGGGAVLAVWRFEWFLLGLLGLRPLLDGLSLGEGQRLLNASTAVGVLFVLASVLWLLGRRASAAWTPMSPAALGLGALACAGGLSVLVSAQPGTSAAAAVRLLSVWLMFAVLEQVLARRVAQVRRVLWSVFVAASLVALWASWQVSTGRGVDPYSGLVRAQGPFVHANVLAKFLVVVLLVLVGCATVLRGARRLGVVAFLVPVTVLIGLTFARSAWLAALAGLLFILAQQHRRLVPVVGGAVVLLFCTVPALSARVTDLWAPPPLEGVPGNSAAWRWGYWQDLLPLWRSSPINGTGLETIPALGGQDLQAHNVWVQVLVEMGGVGLLAFLSVTIGFWVTSRRRLRAAVTPVEVAMARTAAAVALALLILTMSENLLSETTTLWYAAAAMTFGFTPVCSWPGRRPDAGRLGRRSLSSTRQSRPVSHAAPKRKVPSGLTRRRAP